MIDMTPEQEHDLLLKYGIVIEKDWMYPQMYQAKITHGWIYAVATEETKTEAVHKLKRHITSEVPWLTSDLSLDQAFDQYIMYKKLGV